MGKSLHPFQTYVQIVARYNIFETNLLCLMNSRIITGLNFENELKEGDIPSLVLSDRKWKTAHTAGNITLEIPKVYHTII